VLRIDALLTAAQARELAFGFQLFKDIVQFPSFFVFDD